MSSVALENDCHPAEGIDRLTLRNQARLLSRSMWLLPPALALLAVVGLPFDVPVARWFLGEHCPDLVRQVFEEAEPFGNAVGVVFLCIVLWRVDGRLHVLDLALVLCASIGAGLAANAFKLLITRTRPRSFQFEGTVWDTFVEVFPSGRLQSDLQSFPSAHVATAVGLAFALTLLYPRIRGVLFLLAILVAFQRMEIGAHYVSDVLAGGAVGAAVGIFSVQWHVRSGRSPLAQIVKERNEVDVADVLSLPRGARGWVAAPAQSTTPVTG